MCRHHSRPRAKASGVQTSEKSLIHKGKVWKGREYKSLVSDGIPLCRVPQLIQVPGLPQPWETSKTLPGVIGPFVSWIFFTPTPDLTLDGEGSGGAAPGEVRAGVGMMGAASGV